MRHERQPQLIDVQIPNAAQHEEIHPREPERDAVRPVPVQTRIRPRFGPDDHRFDAVPAAPREVPRGVRARPQKPDPRRLPRNVCGGSAPHIVESLAMSRGGLPRGLDSPGVPYPFHELGVGALIQSVVLPPYGVVLSVLAEVHAHYPGEEVYVRTAPFLGRRGASPPLGEAVAVDEVGTIEEAVVRYQHVIVHGVSSEGRHSLSHRGSSVAADVARGAVRRRGQRGLRPGRGVAVLRRLVVVVLLVVVVVSSASSAITRLGRIGE
mmetsp:Transcript_7546/g.18723  ORF Transcript_7546/g.18723 Transcript_7546/m.18723 type:complete len:266 (-) Transcript_7546:612-1409(-)